MSESQRLPASCFLDTWTNNDWTGGLQINSLDDMSTIHVRTVYSLYEITVIDRGNRDVLVRGGRFFPEWTPAVVAGCSLGGSFLKVGGVYVGFSMELISGEQTIITSRIQSIDTNPTTR